MMLRGTLRARFTDAQCGFKAIRRDVARALLPLVQDDTWFFDTELLVLAERSGLRIHEVPVDWVDDPDSRVDVLRTALDDLRGIRRLGWGLLTGRVPRGRVRDELGVRRDAGRLTLASAGVGVQHHVRRPVPAVAPRRPRWASWTALAAGVAARQLRRRGRAVAVRHLYQAAITRFVRP